MVFRGAKGSFSWLSRGPTSQQCFLTLVATSDGRQQDIFFPAGGPSRQGVIIRHATVTSGRMSNREIPTPVKLRTLVAFINENLSSPLTRSSDSGDYVMSA